MVSAAAPGIQDGNPAYKTHSFPFLSYLIQVGSPLVLTNSYFHSLDFSFHLGRRLPGQDLRPPNTIKHKVHIYNVICLCPLQWDHEAIPSRDLSIAPDKAAFSRFKCTKHCSSKVGRVYLKLFVSGSNLYPAQLFLPQMQVDSVHGNWLPEHSALLDHPPGCLCPRNHWPPVLLPTTVLAVPAGRGTSAYPGL